MYELHKEKFGAFVAQLRKEKGYTQKELAEKLYISNKAISKWETGISVPDTALLVPLAELLGVTVTELLLCQKQSPSCPMEAGQIDQAVKTAIWYGEKAPRRAYHNKGRWMILYPLAFLVGLGQLILCHKLGWRMTGNALETEFFLLALFGAYFCFFVRIELPDYYDQNRISVIGDGIFRMNMVGVSFNNRNWPHLIWVGRVWACVSMVGLPLLHLGMMAWIPSVWATVGPYATLTLVLGVLFLPMYWVGKRYES